ncbi:shikimate kinase [Frankia sp. Cppng1_Ct_nod]|uniref:shikimate kinase n=1 Tax=Frankia sp. Cppng1_Ct_nod TaxID=2897162 RepID=UPI0010410075|nr:shikimate kinase [Frankia sp. Cppng1_Ct_nod]
MSATEPRPKRVFLVGLMGAGKSTVGIALAALLGCKYLDNDVLLEQQARASLQELATAGRQALHEQESRQLRALFDISGPFVAGVAASVADRADDMALMVAAGRVVYLRATPATLAQRVGGGEGRPWLADDPLPLLESMFAARDRAFRSVDHVVDTDGRDSEEIAAELAARLVAEE